MSKLMKILAASASLLVSMVVVATAGFIGRAARTPAGPQAPTQKQQDWPAYGGGPENNHYSKLTQINKDNVKRLAVAWSFNTHEEGGLQTSPIIVESVLFGLTPTQKVFALN